MKPKLGQATIGPRGHMLGLLTYLGYFVWLIPLPGSWMVRRGLSLRKQEYMRQFKGHTPAPSVLSQDKR